MKKKNILTAMLAVLLCLGLFGCGKDDSGGTTAPTDAPTPPVTELTMVVTEDTIGQLEDFQDLESVDLTGSTCYAAIRDYQTRHPEVDVTYTVSLGKTEVDPNVTALRLPEGSYDYDTLLENLRYLDRIDSLSLPATELTSEQVDALREAAPGMHIVCTVIVDGVELDSQTTELDLSGMDAAQVAALSEKLRFLPELSKISLMDENGRSKLSIADVKALTAAAPNAVIDYSFELFGKILNTADETVAFENVQIGNEGEQAIRDALDILTNCTYFKLDDCGIDNEILASIRDDYPDTEVVWRVHVWERSWLTDTEVLRAVYHVDDTNSEPLKYLTKVKYIDMGHNTEMVDISFVATMPDLEMVIFSGAPIVDLAPLASCPKLEFLELAWCGLLKDISPLSACKNLKFINLGHTAVSDLSPLDGLPLEQLSFVNSGNKVGFTEADWAAIQARHPDCWITYEPLHDGGATPYSVGWRYQEDHTYTDCYRKVRDVFELDKLTGNASVTRTGNAAVKEVTRVVTSDTISQLDAYPNLEEADLSGSTCYDAIVKYMESHSRVDVVFTVSFGGTTVKNTTRDLTLTQGSYDYDTLRRDLKYVTGLEHLTLPSTTLTAAQLAALKNEAPGLDINYTQTPQTTALDDTVRAVDLSSGGPVEELIAQLGQYPNVAYAELMRPDGTTAFSVADVKKLQTACPGVTFHYSFDLFGKTVSTTDKTIEYVDVSIGDQGEAQIRAALDILTNCTYFKLDGCGLSNAVLARIRDDYPDTEVVWRIYVWQRSWLTDTEVLRAVYHVDDSNSGPFKYLTKVKYMDLGHNTEMVDISFCAYMPDLELAILSGAPIRDLTPLSGCKKLGFLELAWCGYVTDISPLAGCDRLKYLNVGHCRVEDFSCLQHLDLQMLSYVNSGSRVGFTEYDWEQIQAMFPTCWITYNPLVDNEATPYSKGWRYTEAGGYTPIYRKARDVFGYDAMS